MTQRQFTRALVCICAVIAACAARADDSVDVKDQLRFLRQQNAALQEQLNKQQALIESLVGRVNALQETNLATGRQIESLQAQKPTADTEMTKPPSGGFSLGKVSLSGEGGVAFFHSGSEGMYPNSELRVDEAKLFVEAPIWDEVYFFSELNLITREEPDLTVRLGELYLDFENVSKLWGQERALNLRVGRMYIPFGEEYLDRFAIDNPLISHSLSDLWGVDAGVEAYGKLGKWSYAVAVQSGGPSGVRDFSGDKSVAGRISYDPTRWLHLSASGMRTGDLQLPGDYWTALWFASGWILPIGSTNTTTYHANLVEADAEVRLPHGHLKAFGGLIRYDDNDPQRDNRRDIYYYTIEGVHDVTRKLYAAARFSQIFADKGYPIAGNGDMGRYLFGPLTETLWRLSLGVGYRFSDHLVVKTEYSFERGRLLGGEKRNHEDLFALEAAFKF